MRPRLTILGLTILFGLALVAAQAQYQTAHTGTTASLPLYAGGLVQAQPPPPVGGNGGAEPPWVGRIEQKLDRLLKLVEDEAASGDGSKVGGGAAKPQAEDALVAVGGNCAACHAPELARTEGGDFTFYRVADGGLDMIAPATLNEWRTLKRQVDSGKMPPPGNKKNVPALTPQQKQAMDKWLDDNRPQK